MKLQQVSIWTALLVLFGVSAVNSAEPDKAGNDFFEKKIRPVLVQRCHECHSADAKKVKGALLLDSRAAALKGGETGPAVVPGKPEESLLLSALRHEDFEMPPDGRLSKAVIADFEKWIRMGAPDPRVSDAPGVIQKKIDLEAGRKFWAFRPAGDPPPPKVKDSAWPRDDIDRFVLARLEGKGLAPVKDADRLTMIRRIHFDLVGLPPSPADVEAFLQDKSDKALERVVDRLLASPQFGERWGRYWLDIAHYAESNGNVRNFTFPHAWRYRNWVIDAFNNDTPYDQFITQQLAGDLLQADTPEERNANRIATGFLALASKPQKGATLAMDLVAEQIEVATRATMALTVACARCHDHKFDPIPTEDYYALAGMFTSSQTLYGGTGAAGSAPKTGLHVLEGKNPDAARRQREHQEEIAKLRKRQAEIKVLLRKAGRKGKVTKRDKAKKAGKTDKAAAVAIADPKIDAVRLRRENKELASRLKALGKQSGKGLPSAMGVREGSKFGDCRVYLKGETPTGDPIPRGFVRVAMLGAPPKIAPDRSGRLELAQWLTSPDHPLTARVMVNRIWHHLFDSGIVQTVDNFGINGQRPTHPELLDHLARRFVADGWSVKRMIRTIVLTRAYGLSSDHDERAYEVDPENRFIWRRPRRRLDGEAIRDSILAASGQLELEPPTSSVVAGFGDRIIQDNFTVDQFRVANNHRSIYLPIVRNGIPELLSVFDFADASLVVGRRNVTTVPAQELYLMNSPFVVQQSRHFAGDLLGKSELDDAGRIALAYRRAYCRPATTNEISRVEKFLQETESRLRETQSDDADGKVAAWAAFCQALLVSGELRYVK